MNKIVIPVKNLQESEVLIFKDGFVTSVNILKLLPQLKELKDEIKSLRKENSELKSDISNLKSQINSKLSEYHEVMQELSKDVS